jgi:hypothetical protein
MSPVQYHVSAADTAADTAKTPAHAQKILFMTGSSFFFRDFSRKSLSHISPSACNTLPQKI